jgi:hypothetical protein
MNLHVVAYPNLITADYVLVQQCREQYNSLFRIIEPHFTLVFSVPDMPAEEFISEVQKQTSRVRAIPFCFRCVTINKDSFSPNYDAFLVPDEGHSDIMKLHDRLYSGALALHHRMDISYIPHLSIANSTDPRLIKGVVDDWNAKSFEIRGTLDTLDIINYENRQVISLTQIHLSH